MSSSNGYQRFRIRSDRWGGCWRWRVGQRTWLRRRSVLNGRHNGKRLHRRIRSLRFYYLYARFFLFYWFLYFGCSLPFGFLRRPLCLCLPFRKFASSFLLLVHLRCCCFVRTRRLLILKKLTLLLLFQLRCPWAHHHCEPASATLPHQTHIFIAEVIVCVQFLLYLVIVRFTGNSSRFKVRALDKLLNFARLLTVVPEGALLGVKGSFLGL
mmetsp:Transcript_5937/g.21713  ORF Transcript_5937/g.21713 Transcript_5937/m.21713 type:complete len:211 (+) Transcript_5937:685-1317(+)